MLDFTLDHNGRLASRILLVALRSLRQQPICAYIYVYIKDGTLRLSLRGAAMVLPSKSWDRFRWRSLSAMKNAGGDDGP
jgi:hypothetical protein